MKRKLAVAIGDSTDPRIAAWYKSGHSEVVRMNLVPRM
jgi:hypothetical protein